MTSTLENNSRHPDIQVTQYTSPDRQMSLPLTSEEYEPCPKVTAPWLLSPKWSPNELTSPKKKSTKTPKEALSELFNSYLFLQTEFYYPSLMFRDGEPVMNESYGETQHHLIKLRELLGDLESLKVSEADSTNKTKVEEEIRRAIASVNEWIEKEKMKSREFEEKFFLSMLEKERLKEEQVESSGCLIA